MDTVTEGMKTFVFESAAVLQNDPALAVREAATGMNEMFSRGYDSPTVQSWGPKIGVGARTLILGANVFRLQKTFSNQTASLLEKSMDVARIATDLVGLAGAGLRAISPEHAALGSAMLGWSQAADIVSHGARFGMHSAPRMKAWLKFHDEQRAVEKERQRERLGLPAEPIAPPAVTSVAQNLPGASLL